MPTRVPSLIVLQHTPLDGCRVMGNELVLQGLVPVKVLSRVSLRRGQMAAHKHWLKRRCVPL